MNQKRPHVAVVASYGLGDALVFLIIANNLIRNGFEVTFYSTHIAQMSDWIKGIQLKSFPNQYDPEFFFEQYDLTLADFVSFLVDQCPETEKESLKNKVVFVGMSRVEKRFISDDPLGLLTKIKDGKIKEKLIPLCEVAGSHISGLSKTESMAGRMAVFCEKILKLQNVIKENGIFPPQNFVFQRNKKRIIIHPESREAAKNWWPSKFLKLAKRLKNNGWDTVFVVSPDEYKKWEAIVDKKVELITFNSLADLAQYVYESGYMIGNDSGIGHLASCLGIPTVTITKATNKNYRWRPGWANGVVVNAPFQAKIKEIYFWQFFVSVNRVYKVFQQIRT